MSGLCMCVWKTVLLQGCLCTYCSHIIQLYIITQQHDTHHHHYHCIAPLRRTSFINFNNCIIHDTQTHSHSHTLKTRTQPHSHTRGDEREREKEKERGGGVKDAIEISSMMLIYVFLSLLSHVGSHRRRLMHD